MKTTTGFTLLLALSLHVLPATGQERPGTSIADTTPANALQPTALAIGPGDILRRRVGTTPRGEPVWETGRALLDGDTLVFASDEGAVTALPRAFQEGLEVGKVGSRKWIGAALGGAIGLGIAAVAYEPKYARGYDLGHRFTCNIRKALRGRCTPPDLEQVNSRGGDMAVGAGLGILVGGLIGSGVKHVRWGPVEGSVLPAVGPDRLGLTVTIPAR